MNPLPSRNQLSEVPVRFRALLYRKETHIAFLVGALLIVIPVWFNYSQRIERVSRAILNRHDETAMRLITAYPKLLNARDSRNGFTPLHWAVITGRTNLFFWLIEKGAEVDAIDPMGMTPLHKAAVFNRLAFAETLFTKGADVTALGRKYGGLQLMPIHLASEEGHAGMVKFLLSCGSDVNSTTEGANRVTPLHFAAAKGRGAVLEMLLKAGADINALDLARKTPLTWAIESGQDATARILRDNGAIP